MAVISTGSHPKALWPGIKAWWGRNYNQFPQEWKEIFDLETSNKAYEEDVEITGFGLAPIKSEGAAVEYDQENQGLVSRYVHIAYSLGYIVTKEELDDNQYEVVSKRRTEALAFSVRQTLENVGANILNRAFNTSYAPTGETGVSLCSTSHVTGGGLTQSNRLATDADLSEASLEDMIVQIMTAQNARGLRISLTPRKMIVPPQLVFTAQRILKSDQRVNTANNDVNAVKSMGLLPGGAVVNHYLTDTDAWFIKTDAPRGLIAYERQKADFNQDNDFDTSNAKAKSYVRMAFGATDFRGIYGTPGA